MLIRRWSDRLFLLQSIDTLKLWYFICNDNKLTFKILSTYVFNSEWIGMLFRWLRIPAPLIFVMLWMIVFIVLIGVSEGRWAHHCDGSVNMKSWISISRASYSSSLARSPISFTFRQIHFIRSSVNFGRALPEHVSFRRRTRALWRGINLLWILSTSN